MECDVSKPRRFNTTHVVPLATKRVTRTRPATVGADVVALTILFFVLAALTVASFRHGWIEVGTAASMALAFFVWRVWAWDANRLIENSVRHYQQAVRPQPRIRPVTVESTDGGWTVRYGQLDATEQQYRELLAAVKRHPRHRLTRDAVPPGMIVNLTEAFPGLVKELRRLEWLDANHIVTRAGMSGLETLAAGDSPY